MASFKAQVKVAGDPKWYDNALRFATEEEAKAYGSDLFSRWMQATEYEAVPSEDPVNYVWVDGQAKPIGESSAA